MIPLKSEEDLKMLRISGEILSRVMRRLEERVKADVLTLELDLWAQDLLEKEKAVSAFKGYRGFPANICTSVNEEIVHGIPGKRRLKEGDIISLDVGINYRGYFSDAAVTLPVGKVAPQEEKLIEVTKNALVLGVGQAAVNNRVSDISCAIQAYVEKNGFSVVRDFVGHGIGLALHEEPEIPNFGVAGNSETIKSGMVFAIEPMVNMGGWESEILDNGWTAVTRDRMPSAHFEYTVAVTEAGPEILTNY